MTTTIQDYALTWTADGMPRASAVGDDEASAGRRKRDLEAAGSTGVRIVPGHRGETLPGSQG
ncbi:hypothetical protein ACFXGI_35265 [Streptomyces sp. NPDC059355]|uniref:hypothetical protein n=1 Tax=Streptomyces sp. NPDC059355 TaxID=3346811 RepID=UPI0036BF6239